MTVDSENKRIKFWEAMLPFAPTFYFFHIDSYHGDKYLPTDLNKAAITTIATAFTFITESLLTAGSIIIAKENLPLGLLVYAAGKVPLAAATVALEGKK